LGNDAGQGRMRIREPVWYREKVMRLIKRERHGCTGEIFHAGIWCGRRAARSRRRDWISPNRECHLCLGGRRDAGSGNEEEE
jgi:hypothetical protein